MYIQYMNLPKVISIHTHAHAHAQAHTHAHTHTHSHTHTCTHMCTQTHTHIHPDTYTHTHTHMHLHIYTHTHIVICLTSLYSAVAVIGFNQSQYTLNEINDPSVDVCVHLINGTIADGVSVKYELDYDDTTADQG